MADKKISALTAASTPLAGTEVLPIVQSGSTVKVAVSNLTEGRSVGAAKVNVNTSTEFGLVNVNSTGASDTLMTLGDFTTPGNSVGIYGRVNGSGVFSIKTAGVAIRLSSDASLANPVDILDGNVVIGTSGKGIDFSATPGTGTSELLADYEEGTWTPVISDGTNNATMGASNSGTYTRVGRMVTVTGYVQMSSKGSISGALRMTGLPFTVGTVYSGASVGFADGLSVTAGVTIGMYAAVSTTYTLLQKFSATTGSTDLLATDTTNSGQFIFSLTYFV